MKIFKSVFSVLIVTVVVLFASQTHLYGVAGGPNPWAVNAGARGDRGTGTLTIYGEVVDPATPGYCSPGDTEIRPYFFLRLKFGKVETNFSRLVEANLCHPSDYAGEETVALHEFLRVVADELKPGSGYGTCEPDPFGLIEPDNPCPNILRSFKEPLDSEGDFNANIGELSIIGPVVLRIQ